MSELLETIFKEVGSSSLAQAGTSVGASPAATEAVAAAAIPALVAALARNASTPEGASALSRTLEQHHAPSLLEQLAPIASLLGSASGGAAPASATGGPASGDAASMAALGAMFGGGAGGLGALLGASGSAGGSPGGDAEALRAFATMLGGGAGGLGAPVAGTAASGGASPGAGAPAGGDAAALAAVAAMFGGAMGGSGPSGAGGLGAMLGGAGGLGAMLGGAGGLGAMLGGGGGLGPLLSIAASAMAGGGGASALPEALRGDKIVSHVLGGASGSVTADIARESGVEPATVAALLPVLAPVVMSALGTAKKESGMGPGALATFLSGQAAELGVSTGGGSAAGPAEPPGAPGLGARISSGARSMIGRLFGR